MKRLVLPAALTAFLTGCIPSEPAVVNVNRAQLMPDMAAKRVLEKYIKADWVNNPYFICPDMFGAQRAQGSMTSIVMIRYVPSERELYIGNMAWGSMCQNGRTGWITVNGISQESANEVATALVSLGARTGE